MRKPAREVCFKGGFDMHIRIGVVGALLICSTLAHGQQGLPGTYEADFSGFSDSGREWSQRVTLVITSAENGKVAGKYHVPKYSCAGDYLIEGTVRENHLELTTSPGTMRGCGNAKIVLTVDGTRLIGKVTTYDAEFRRK